MSSELLQYYELERKRKETAELVKSHRVMPGKKPIATVHICYNCNRQFVYNRKRRHCPSCRNLLRTKIMIMKKP